MNPTDSNPAAPSATTVKTYDPLLDPLPQPEVVESNTDTAWSRWEDLVRAEDACKDDEPQGPDFEDTVPTGL
ncbi:MAG: hypothetical protein A3F78_15610 [Burkholderiales bacterium RIFCSPLOWO2_12_FULL_61_40]|nr:MAG: hypothetical protein A3F78_15610 [Burkholderiales bacterium RIFCSPLOWO2_12_FULL_61_40]